MNPVRKKYMPRRQGNNPDMAISTRLARVLLQPLLASYSGFSLPLHSPLCLVSEKPDYFANRAFATHPNARFGFNLMERAILFYDGHCALCQFWVQFLLQRDFKDRFRFASLQSAIAQKAGVTADGDLAPDTVVLQYADRTYTHSDAALLALQLLGGLWRIVVVLRWIPRPIRDAVYRWIARYRYAWWGRKDTCYMPQPQWRHKFLEEDGVAS
jgi:predicted DCC family thiol-disulfide oxidoreductase YuxK